MVPSAMSLPLLLLCRIIDSFMAIVQYVLGLVFFFFSNIGVEIKRQREMGWMVNLVEHEVNSFMYFYFGSYAPNEVPKAYYECIASNGANISCYSG